MNWIEVESAVVGFGCGAYVGWTFGVASRRVQRAREEAYVDGVLDRDAQLRPDAGKGGAQPLEDDQ